MHTSKIKPGKVTKPRRNGVSEIQKFHHRSFIVTLTHLCNAINKILDKLKFCLTCNLSGCILMSCLCTRLG